VNKNPEIVSAHGRTLLIALGIFILMTGVAVDISANDTGGKVLPAGGVIFEKTDKISMESEVLRIGRHRIDVSYIFKNQSDSDVIIKMMFPLPVYNIQDLDPDDEEFRISKIVGFKSFQVQAGTITVSYETTLRAKAGFSDITVLLNSLRIPLADYVAASKRIAMLSNDERFALTKVLALDLRGRPRWELHTTFIWNQNFPAMQSLTIHHSYIPITWSTLGWNYNRMFMGLGPYCADKDSISRLESAKGQTLTIAEKLGYILSTARNWKGPIHSFELIIDKGRSSVLTCFAPLALSEDGTLRATLADYTPNNDLQILFLESLKDLNKEQEDESRKR